MDTVLYETAGAVATVTLNRPDKHNALNDPSLYLLGELVARADDDDSVKVIVVKGNGPSFCSGHDLNFAGKVYGMNDGRTAEERRARPGQRTRLAFDRKIHEVYYGLVYTRKPLIAQVHGHCIGAGMFITEFADLAICAEDASFAHREQRLAFAGVAPSIVSLLFSVGPKKTRELMLLGEAIDGREAERIGLVNKAVPAAELDAEVARWTELICRNGKDAIGIGKAFYQMTLDSLGFTSQLVRGYFGHTLGTNLRWEPDEYNFFRQRREEGTSAGVHGRDEFFAGSGEARPT